ncbi:hypothetical protein [Deminuibacter soli]|uniref:Uncharacterized protein n=1 Tax=Deminuibacter soli TaxID=2291815 RepID=A0A3E1NEJ7_9BACT|nr:hypothetical protein [Deminuibacter soli]RFM26221.1 hypothetical protein DXN05_21740 [Deminuibacter soli]
MFPDYELLVWQDYQKKKTANVLPVSLTEPTPGQLKTECAAVCNVRFRKKDEKILVAVFGKNDDLKGYLTAIDQYKTDLFKSLVNYLKQETKSTSKKNIELLAWLIDFEPRPFEYGKKYVIKEEEKEIFEEIEETEKEADVIAEGVKEEGETKKPEAVNPPTIIPGKPHPSSKIRSIIAAVALLLVAVGGFTLFHLWRASNTQMAATLPTDNNDTTNKHLVPGQCMHWTGDHYEVIACNPGTGDTFNRVPLDTAILNNFKRIVQWDTITYKSIGFVWYVKVNRDSLEYYTSSGFHPIYNQLRLRQITRYIIDKHILH